MPESLDIYKLMWDELKIEVQKALDHHELESCKLDTCASTHTLHRDRKKRYEMILKRMNQMETRVL